MRYIPISFLFLLFFAPWASGQQFHSGLMPEVSLSYKWSDVLQQTLKIESAHELTGPESEGFAYAYDQTDIQVFLEGRLNPFIKIAGGYQYRLEGDGDNPHRFIQQAAVLQRKESFRLGHRLRTDQTVYSTDPVKWRLRYRISAEFPLEGQSLDAGEFYLITSGEPIYSWQDSAHDVEVRIATSLGYFISDKSELEVGLDYRMEKLLTDPYRQKMWVRIGWFYVI